MPIVPGGFVSHAEIAGEVDRAIAKLGPEVVRVRYSVGEDNTGDPAIYFRIVLTDGASREETLGEVTEKIRRTLSDELRSFENWGLFPYFRFRSQKEQALLQDPAWT